MTRQKKGIRILMWGAAGCWILMSLVACAKKTDPAAANAGGGAAVRRNVLTMQGAAR